MKVQHVAYSFRRGTKNDIDQIKDVTWHAYSQYAGIVTDATLQAWKVNLNTEKTYLDLFQIADCFVCESNAKIRGAIFLIPQGNPSQFFPANWAYIRLLAVNSEFAGKGIGKKLTEMCIQQAKHNKEKIIGLHTSEFQNAARNIYEKLGFEQQKEFELYGKKYWIYKLELDKI